jgi:hypothetical protein
MEKNKIELPKELESQFELASVPSPKVFYKGKEYVFAKLTAKQAEFLSKDENFTYLKAKPTKTPVAPK